MRLASSLLLLVLLAGCAPAGARDEHSRFGPAYGPGAVQRLAFQGVHLGMAYEDACQRLRAMGYVRRTLEENRASCAAPSRDGGDTFFGRRPSPDHAPVPPGSPAASVASFSLSTGLSRGRLVVTGIWVLTNEPRQQAALRRAAIAQWGRPTRDEDVGYLILGYGLSRGQLDMTNRENFSSCRMNPVCTQRSGADCGAALSTFGTAYARMVIYDWGRTIEISDYRHDRRAADIVRRRRWTEAPPNRCLPMPL